PISWASSTTSASRRSRASGTARRTEREPSAAPREGERERERERGTTPLLAPMAAQRLLLAPSASVARAARRDRLRGDPHDRRVGGDVLRDDGVRPDPRVVSDRDGPDDLRAGADEDVVADHGAL